MNYRKKIRLGDVLVKKGIIDENQLQTALSRQREQGKMLGEMVIDRKSTRLNSSHIL